MASGRITSASDKHGLGFKIHLDWEEKEFYATSSKVVVKLWLEIPGKIIRNALRPFWISVNGDKRGDPAYKIGTLAKKGEYRIGEEYYTFIVARDSNGNANCTFEAYLDLNLTGDGYETGGILYKIYDFSIPATVRALSTIDQTPPTISPVNITNIGTDHFTIEATASHSSEVSGDYTVFHDAWHHVG